MMPPGLPVAHGRVAFSYFAAQEFFQSVNQTRVRRARNSLYEVDKRSAGGATMGSTSDAAPLPRLGEVFFDVRGSSRSMRLSWYADTGIAVFSIWQGGTCTGTFRLPLDDLSRLVESLGRGLPDGAADAGGRT